MKNKIYISIALIVALMGSGCSSIMPYKSEFSCEKGKGEGVCDSVSNTHKMLNNPQGAKSTDKSQHEESEMIYYKQGELNFDHCYNEIQNQFCISNPNVCSQAENILFKKCIEKAKQDYFLAHKDSIVIINKLMSYQHLENERLRQKLELEYGVNYDK